MHNIHLLFQLPFVAKVSLGHQTPNSCFNAHSGFLTLSNTCHISSIAHTCVPAAKAKVSSPEGGIHSTQPSLACADAADFEDPDTGNTLNTTAVCLFWQNQAAVVAATRITTIQTTLNNRLTVAATVGDTALATAVTAIQTATPEVAEVILADTGADPLKYPYLVSTSCLLCTALPRLCCIHAERHHTSVDLCLHCFDRH